MKSIGRLLCAVMLCASAVGQAPRTEERPLGDLAREARAKAPTVKAKMVVDSDSIRSSGLPIPDIRLDSDNSDEIVRAVLNYASAHTPKELEDMVHSWYDRQDSAAQAASDDNHRTQERQMDSYYNYPTDIKDYQKYQQEQRAKQILARQDSQRSSENYKLIQKTATAMQQIKSKLAGYRISYDWMKVRYSYDY